MKHDTLDRLFVELAGSCSWNYDCLDPKENDCLSSIMNRGAGSSQHLYAFCVAPPGQLVFSDRAD